MKRFAAAIALFFSSLLCGQEDLFRFEYELLLEKIPHEKTVDFQNSKILTIDGKAVGIVFSEEHLIPSYKPNLPDKKQVTHIEYGSGRDVPFPPAFIISDKKEIELVYSIFERFSSRRLINKRYYRIIEGNKIDEIDLGRVDELSMHLCTNGFYFYSGDELLMRMDSHTNDEQFFGSENIFINHPMVAYINYKTEEVNQSVDTTPVSAPR